MDKLERVMGLEEWFNNKYPELYGFRVMEKYQEWLDYRNQIMANNRVVIAKRKRMTENGLKSK